MMTNKPIKITNMALQRLLSLNCLEMNKVYLRISVKQGGCSGMSYLMNFVKSEDLQKADSIIEFENFQIVCDSKSLLYLYGMSLDYEDSLIGGGFQFSNPNALNTCGCGKSFSV
ncbi:iron-sulfur cluster assembly accessory protein (plastid) [Chondrus crispus]|uniref:Iron-sulfur cluster assembly accessory protein n=1 Tax=Chondrus crispus TaxID=2769 RepID=M5DC04_CHOCR|nr:iron-sulfur cluster assembly accessory protein [Chondrus crispus]CCP38207.1 iron-sulfur cluster assembly accessory protein [Chondrus crispus]|eukprot:YP_007627460.1 iron-sulfur cluster assembly accessory protein (plastid) [Chondrus crispus]